MRGRSINSEGFAGAGSRSFSQTSARFIASYSEKNRSNVGHCGRAQLTHFLVHVTDNQDPQVDIRKKFLCMGL